MDEPNNEELLQKIAKLDKAHSNIIKRWDDLVRAVMRVYPNELTRPHCLNEALGPRGWDPINE